MQIEYALARVQQGKMSLGIKGKPREHMLYGHTLTLLYIFPKSTAKNGVVIATDKKVSSILVDGEDYQKIQNITPSTGTEFQRSFHFPFYETLSCSILLSSVFCFFCVTIGFVYSGMGPDFRVLVRSARKQAQQYFLTYREVQPVNQIVRESALLMQEYTQSGGVRPFGVSCLVAGWDEENGPQLFQVDPSGSSFGWKATAIGKNYVNAKNFLERRYDDEVELDDAVHIALLTLRESYEGEMTEHNIEVGIISAEEKVFRILTPQEVRDYLDEAN